MRTPAPASGVSPSQQDRHRAHPTHGGPRRSRVQSNGDSLPGKMGTSGVKWWLVFVHEDVLGATEP